MAKPIRLKMEYLLDGDQQPTQVTVDLRDMRAWERNNGGQPFAVDQPDMGRLTYVAWHAARREGKYEGQWMAFDSNCVSLTDLEEEEVDPTVPTLGAS